MNDKHIHSPLFEYVDSQYWLRMISHLVDVSPLPCLRCFHGGWWCPQGAHRPQGAILWVARHDSQAEESFCSGDHPFSVNTLELVYTPCIDADKALQIWNTVWINEDMLLIW